MKIEDLMKIPGEKIVKIKENNTLFEDSYAEPGMIGKIISITKDREGYYRVKIDWNGFEDYNEQFEAKDWYIDDIKQGTMKEAGMYPKDGIEEYFVDPDSDDFELTDDIIVNYLEKYNEYVNSLNENETPMTFVRWLISLIEK